MSTSLSQLRSYSFSDLKHYAKISDVTPERMQPTKKSVALQISIIICGLFIMMAHGLYRDSVFISYTAAIIWVIAATLLAYYEVDLKAFKLLAMSFRGGIIMFSTMLSILLTIFRKLLYPIQDSEPLLTLIIMNFAFLISIMTLMSADCIPRVINLIRLFGPLGIIANVIWYV